MEFLGPERRPVAGPPGIWRHAVESEHKQPIDLVHLGRYTMNDPALGREILTLFAGQLPETLRQLREAESPHDWKIAAHTLKGSARAVGAWPLAERAAEAEAAGPDDGDRCHHLKALAAEAETTARFVAEVVARPG